jgi:hypothetical protein
MLSRQDGENIFLMYSDMLYFWYTKENIAKPTFPWEFVQLGNCGSPLETEAGWLVLSHGVGPLRKYSIGAFLLDRDAPSRLIGRLKQPLLTPNENEREGYVPNVVYSCGAVVHNGQSSPLGIETNGNFVSPCVGTILVQSGAESGYEERWFRGTPENPRYSGRDVRRPPLVLPSRRDNVFSSTTNGVPTGRP